MHILDLPLPEAKLITPKVFHDQRGYFLESFSEVTYATHGIPSQFVQDNHSYSKKNCLRGMHFQSTPGQGKLVRCAHGNIYDVIVDIRPSSPTFKRWISVMLDGSEHQQLYIPVGFAHGFYVLSEYAHVLYKVTTPYNLETEVGFLWDDPDIDIQWPSPSPILSARDRNNPHFKDILPLLQL